MCKGNDHDVPYCPLRNAGEHRDSPALHGKIDIVYYDGCVTADSGTGGKCSVG